MSEILTPEELNAVEEWMGRNPPAFQCPNLLRSHRALAAENERLRQGNERLKDQAAELQASIDGFTGKGPSGP